MSKLDKDALANAAQAMCDHGIEIRSPDDGDLDDLEAERYDALCAAILAYLTTPGISSPAAEPVASSVAVPLDDLLFAYRGLLVLLIMCKRAGLSAGVDATKEILGRLEIIEPALPSLSALREQKK